MSGIDEKPRAIHTEIGCRVCGNDNFIRYYREFGVAYYRVGYNADYEHHDFEWADDWKCSECHTLPTGEVLDYIRRHV